MTLSDFVYRPFWSADDKSGLDQEYRKQGTEVLSGLQEQIGRKESQSKEE